MEEKEISPQLNHKFLKKSKFVVKKIDDSENNVFKLNNGEIINLGDDLSVC